MLPYMTGTRAITLLGAAFAAAACLWFALGWHQAKSTDAAAAQLLATPHPTARQIDHMKSLVASAGRLNPDREPAMLSADLLERAGKSAAALRAVTKLTRAEPENVEYWILAYDWTDPADTQARQRLLTRIEALQPPVGSGG